MITIIIVAILALAAGAALGSLSGRSSVSKLESALAAKDAELTLRMQEAANRAQELERAHQQTKEANDLAAATQAELARLNERLEQERRANTEKLEMLTRASQELQNAFQKLAADALASNNQRFLELAKTRLETFQQQAEGELAKREQAVANLVKPISESLANVDKQIQEIEKTRVGAYNSITEQLKFVTGTQEQLRSETTKLVQALRRPEARGRWGELQLRRVVEMAGMLDYCDFVEQQTARDDDGRALRPDVIVRLPGGKQVIVDSKAPLDAYLKAIEATDEATRNEYLAAHARQIQDHISKLSQKRYWEQFENSPEFVVMFLPGEVFFSAALEQNPALIESGVQERVIPASPTTLIALLRAVAYGWQQTKLAENAQKISELGKKLYDNLRVMAGHMDRLGDSLEKSMKAYNQTVGSMERTVFPTARKFPELAVSATEEIPQLEQKDETPRLLQAADWIFEEKANAAKA